MHCSAICIFANDFSTERFFLLWTASSRRCILASDATLVDAFRCDMQLLSHPRTKCKNNCLSFLCVIFSALAIKKHSHTDTQQVFVYFHSCQCHTSSPVLCQPLYLFPPFSEKSLIPPRSRPIPSCMFRSRHVRVASLSRSMLLCIGIVCVHAFSFLPAVCSLCCWTFHFSSHPSCSSSCSLSSHITENHDRNFSQSTQKARPIQRLQESKNPHCYILSKVKTHISFCHLVFINSMQCTFTCTHHTLLSSGGGVVGHLRFCHPLTALTRRPSHYVFLCCETRLKLQCLYMPHIHI